MSPTDKSIQCPIVKNLRCCACFGIFNYVYSIEFFQQAFLHSIVILPPGVHLNVTETNVLPVEDLTKSP